ncbi:hypothetical protein [Nostoc sp.]|uniref:hypothetical protein n=1 Tax=Nostoc sp. TaxID=1180 RepID=UPI002FF650F7
MRFYILTSNWSGDWCDGVSRPLEAMSTTGYAYVKNSGTNTDGLVKSGISQQFLLIIEVHFSQDKCLIAVSDLVRYVFKATNLVKQDLGVPQLLRKRYT